MIERFSASQQRSMLEIWSQTNSEKSRWKMRHIVESKIINGCVTLTPWWVLCYWGMVRSRLHSKSAQLKAGITPAVSRPAEGRCQPDSSRTIQPQAALCSFEDAFQPHSAPTFPALLDCAWTGWSTALAPSICHTMPAAAAPLILQAKEVQHFLGKHLPVPIH